MVGCRGWFSDVWRDGADQSSDAGTCVLEEGSSPVVVTKNEDDDHDKCDSETDL